MGTIADKLQAVLNSKNAIKSKFNLSDDLPFSQYADNINIHVDVSGGIDFSFITAEANDILEGKVSVDKDGKQITGVLKPGTDVSDTTATAPDVLEGKQFYNAQGVLTQGTLVPQSGGGGSIDFFKCAAVAGEEKEPMPEPVFAEKFEGTLTNDFEQLGEAPVFETIDGRQCMKCDYDHRLSTSCDGFPSGNAPRTMSAWLYCNSGSLSGEWSMLCIYGSADGFGMRAYNGELYADGTAWQPYETIGDLQENVWQHIVLVGEGNKTVGYINGVRSGEVTYELETVLTGGLQIGYQYGSESSYSTDGYISDLQIYDTALTAEQVAELHQSQTISLVFHAPLAEQKSTAETGQALLELRDVTYQEVEGRKCVYLENSCLISNETTSLPSGDSARTVSFFVNYKTRSDYSVVSFGSVGIGNRYGTGVDNDGQVCIWGYQTNATFANEAIELNKWYCITTTFEGNTAKLYINGDFIEERTLDGINTINTTNNGLVIGGEANTSNDETFTGYISEVKIFNTVLTAEQVKELYAPSYEPEAPLPPNTWNGYKALLVNTDDGKAYYEFSETLTEGLTYGKGFTPVVDYVYDAEAMIRAELHTARIITCPVNMTATENEEWVISASASFAEHVFLRSFDGSIGSIWAGTGGSDWIQWQNKNEPVLVKQLEISYENHHFDHVTDLLLQGSNDGQSWTTIGETFALSWEVSGEYDATAKVTFPSNTTKYFYHRLTCNRESSYRALIGTLITKSVID